MDITVLVCTFNGAERLPVTLRHLMALTTSEVEWELLVVDNGSTDDTCVVIERECAKWPEHIRRRVCTERRPGKGYALELGFREAEGRYVVVCDDDMWFGNDYLECAVEVMDQRRQVGVLRGMGVPIIPGAVPDWFDDYAHIFGVGDPGIASGDVTETLGSFGGAGTVLRKEAIDQIMVAGFHFALPFPGEDMELCYVLRLAGYRLWYDSRIRFQHVFPVGMLNWRKLLQRNARNGRLAPHWQAFIEVIDGTFGCYRAPSNWYFLQKILPSMINGHLLRVVWRMLRMRATGQTRQDAYRSQIYQLSVWVGYVSLGRRFSQEIRRAIDLRKELHGEQSPRKQMESSAT